MKTLDQWLEDSDEEETGEEEADDDDDGRQESGAMEVRNGSEDRGSSSSRVVSASRTSGAPSLTGSYVSAHTPNTVRPTEHPAGGLYAARQEETREKMRRLLGADVVVKATTPTSSSAGGAGSPTWPISAPPDRTHFPFGATPTATQPVTQGLWAPPALGKAAAADARAGGGTPFGPNRTDTATDSSQLPEVEQTMTGFSDGLGGGGGGGGAALGPAYAAVEVMVVDRGTQTVTSEGTQTDPLPITLGPYYTGPMMPVPYGGFHGVPAPSYGVPPPSLGLGVDGRPYRQYLYDYEKKEAEEAGRLREELGMIQNSIDMLIARYNLPPPPM